MAWYSYCGIKRNFIVMLNYKQIETYPELVAILKHIDERIAEASCPPEQEIWNNKRLCKELSISTRKASYLREKGKIQFSKVDGLIFYTKASVLRMISDHSVKSRKGKSRFKN